MCLKTGTRSRLRRCATSPSTPSRGRTSITGQGARRTTDSATLPSTRRPIPLRPCVLITTRSAPTSAAYRNSASTTGPSISACWTDTPARSRTTSARVLSSSSSPLLTLSSHSGSYSGSMSNAGATPIGSYTRTRCTHAPLCRATATAAGIACSLNRERSTGTMIVWLIAPPPMKISRLPIGP